MDIKKTAEQLVSMVLRVEELKKEIKELTKDLTPEEVASVAIELQGHKDFERIKNLLGT